MHYIIIDQFPAEMKILFLGKKDNSYVKRALDFAEKHFETASLLGKWGDVLPDWVYWWKGDYIISFLSPWVVPGKILEKVKGINFHPASPDYPGIGCTNFALYNNEGIYGVTCHYMEKTPDTGKIIKVLRFPIFNNDTVLSLTERTYAYLLVLFYDILSWLDDLPSTNRIWARKPYTRKELDELRRITLGMSAEEVRKRVRASSYPGWEAYIEVEEMRFYAE